MSLELEKAGGAEIVDAELQTVSAYAEAAKKIGIKVTKGTMKAFGAATVAGLQHIQNKRRAASESKEKGTAKQNQQQSQSSADSIKVFVGGRKALHQEPGKAPHVIPLSDKQSNLIEKAILNPSEAKKGTVQVKIGNREVYRVVNGKVESDLLGLSSRHQQNQTQAQSKSQTAAEAPKQGLNSTQSPSRTERSEAIRGPVAYQSDMAETQAMIREQQRMIREQQKQLERLSVQVSLLTKAVAASQNPKLSKWLSTQANRAQATVGKVKNRVSEQLSTVRHNLTEIRQDVSAHITASVDGARNKLNGAAFDSKLRVSNSINAVTSTAKAAITDAQARLITQAAKTILSRMGKQQDDGSVVLKGKQFTLSSTKGQIAISNTQTGAAVMVHDKVAPTATQGELNHLTEMATKIDKAKVATAKVSQQQTKSQASKVGLRR